jgi:hypothetical protein
MPRPSCQVLFEIMFREVLTTPTFLQMRQSTKNDKQIIIQFSDLCLFIISLVRQRGISQSNFLTVALFVIANKVFFTTYLSIRFQWFASYYHQKINTDFTLPLYSLLLSAMQYALTTVQ